MDPSTPIKTAPRSPATPSGTGRTQALKDLKLTIEYKHLKQNAPGGVLVTPSFDDLRLWHGVIFVRKGLYQGGVFKFVVKLPRAYNDADVWPEIRFTSEVFNPFVSPGVGASALPDGASGISGAAAVEESGGLLDLKSSYPKWDPTAHFMVTALTFLKKIFYLKDDDLAEYTTPANPEAAKLFLDSKVCALFRAGLPSKPHPNTPRSQEDFQRRAVGNAERSQDRAYDSGAGSPLVFSPPTAAHEEVRRGIVSVEDHHAPRPSSFLADVLKRAHAASAAGAGGVETRETGPMD